MKFPKISIITPSLNQGKFIEQTIKSVLSQKYPNLEYIIVDGGSTDSTLRILRKYSKQIKWTSEKDKGQADAINKGMRMAKGDIIAYINSDDYYLPNTFSAVADFFNRNKDAKWLTGDYIIVDEKGKKIQPSVTLYKKLLRFLGGKNILSIVNYIAQPSTFWKRSVVSDVGFFNDSLKYVFDYDYWMRIIRQYPLFRVTSHLSAFRIHSQAKGSLSFDKQFDEELKVLRTNTKNKLLIGLHLIHNSLIVQTYKLIK